jgi:putative membrane protein
MRVPRRTADVGAALLGVGFIVWLLRDGGVDDVGRCFARMGWGAVLGLVPYTLASVCDTRGWQMILGAISRARVPFGRLWLVRAAGEAVNSAAPTGVGGEPLKVALLRRHGVAGSDAAAAVLVSRTGVVVAQSVVVVVGLTALVGRLGYPWAAAGVLTVLMALTALFALALVHIQRRSPVRAGARALGAILPRAAARLGDRLGLVDERLSDFYARHRRVFLGAFAWHLLAWVVTAVEVWLLFRLVGDPMTPRDALIVEGMAQPIRATAVVVPGALGTQEGAGVALSVWLGSAREPAIAMWLARRIREVLFDIVGFAYLPFARADGRGLAGTARLSPGRAAASGEAGGAPYGTLRQESAAEGPGDDA